MPTQRHLITPIAGVDVHDVFESDARIYVRSKALITSDA